MARASASGAARTFRQAARLLELLGSLDAAAAAADLVDAAGPALPAAGLPAAELGAGPPPLLMLTCEMTVSTSCATSAAKAGRRDRPAACTRSAGGPPLGSGRGGRGSGTGVLPFSASTARQSCRGAAGRWVHVGGCSGCILEGDRMVTSVLIAIAADLELGERADVVLHIAMLGCRQLVGRRDIALRGRRRRRRLAGRYRCRCRTLAGLHVGPKVELRQALPQG